VRLILFGEPTSSGKGFAALVCLPELVRLLPYRLERPCAAKKAGGFLKRATVFQTGLKVIDVRPAPGLPIVRVVVPIVVEAAAAPPSRPIFHASNRAPMIRIFLSFECRTRADRRIVLSSRRLFQKRGAKLIEETLGQIGAVPVFEKRRSKPFSLPLSFAWGEHMLIFTYALQGKLSHWVRGNAACANKVRR
jgi:hypothetical protein